MAARTFGFASLLLSAGAAHAEDLPAAAVEAPVEAAPHFGGDFHVTREGNELVIQMAVKNMESHSESVLVSRGIGPGAGMYATILQGGERVMLERVMGEEELHSMISRMGPLPRYEPVLAGESVDVGTFRFTLPEGADPATIELEATVSTGSARAVLKHHLSAPST